MLHMVLQARRLCSCWRTAAAGEYAMKLFLSDSNFRQEKALYMDPNEPLGRFLPELHSIVESPAGGFVDAFGRPMPPCIVMEKGESLDMWAARGEGGMDVVTGLQVLNKHTCGPSVTQQAHLWAFSYTTSTRAHVRPSTGAQADLYAPSCTFPMGLTDAKLGGLIP
jgi:hypothetical protein